MDAMRRRRSALAATLLAATLVVPACGGDDDDNGGGGSGNGGDAETLTAEQVSSLEARIKDRLSDSGSSTSTTPSSTVDAVNCPDDIPAEEGAKFDCTATTSFGDQTVKVTLLSADGQSYEYETTSP